MRSTFLSCVMVLLLATSAGAKLLTADLVRETQPLLPYVAWLMDPEGKESIDSIAAGNVQDRFTPLVNGIPLKYQGPVWLRLTVIKTPPGQSGNTARAERPRLVVNLGELPPGGARMFVSEAPGPVAAPKVWHSETVASHSEVTLAEPGLLPMSIYFRLESMPGLWFSPTVTLQGTQDPNLLSSELLLPGLLIVAFAACLLRAIAGRAQWALWAAAFLGCALAQSVLPLPALNRPLTLHDLPAMLAPGMALVLLPHVGRCMLRTHTGSAFQDALLYFCSLLGMAVCLAPLVPGMSWLARLFPLWPLLLLPVLPVCVSALAGKRPGALAFAGACAMPLLGAALALHAIDAPSPHPLALRGSLWGLAVGGLGLALARIPRTFAAKAKDEQENTPDEGLRVAYPLPAPDRGRETGWDQGGQTADAAVMPGAAPDVAAASLPSGTDREAPAPSAGPAEEPSADPRDPAGPTDPADLASPADPAADWHPQDPAYPYVAGGLTFGSFTPLASHSDRTAPDDSAEDAPSPLPEPTTAQDRAPARDEAESRAAAQKAYPPAEQEADDPGATPGTAPEMTPDTIPGPIQDGTPRSDDLPAPATPPVLENAPAAAVLSKVLPDFADLSDAAALPTEDAKVISLLDDDFSPYSNPLLEELQEENTRHTTLTSTGAYLFNLPSLVREVHDTVQPLAKNKGLLFSWYIAPSLPVLLEGDAPRLRGALSLLLQNAVQATHQGSVQLAVRKNPGGGPGDLIFSIADSGSGQRTDAGFFHAWELAARTGGVFNVDYSPKNGTQISFTVHFILPSEEAALEHSSGIAKAVRWDDAPAPLSEAPQSPSSPPSPYDQTAFQPTYLPAFQAAMESLPQEGGAGHEGREKRYGTSAQSSPQTAGTADTSDAATPDLPSGAFLSPFAPEEPVLAAMSPEQAPAQRAFLDPLPGETAPPASPAPAGTGTAGTGFRSQADLDQPGAVPLLVAAEMTNSKRKLLSHYLADLPHEHVDTAKNAQVIALIQERPVSLVIFDADMPEADIIKTVESLRREERAVRHGTVPVLVLTGHEAQSERMRKAGATHTLCKPFTKESLCDCVRRAVPAFSGAQGLAAFPALTDPAGLPGFPELVATNSTPDTEATPQATARSGQADQPGQPGQPAQDPFVSFIRHGYKKREPAVHYAEDQPSGVRRTFADTGDAGSAVSEALAERQSARAAFPENEPPREETPPRQEIDLLEAALRDAPSQQGEAILVSLPSLHEAPGPTPPAAPMILGLSEEDVTPYTEKSAAETPLLDLILPEPSPAPVVRPVAPVVSGTPAGEADAPANDTTKPARTVKVSSQATASVKVGKPATTKRVRVSAPKQTPPPAEEAATARENAAATQPLPEQASSLPLLVAPPAKVDETPLSPPPPPTPEPSEEPLLPQLFALPGMEGETVEMALLPLIPGLIHSLADAMTDARQGSAEGKSLLVQEAAGRLSGRAEVFGLSKLSKIGRCVERAAEADDLEAVATLLEDLEIITKRYMESLKECFQSFLGVDR